MILGVIIVTIKREIAFGLISQKKKKGKKTLDWFVTMSLRLQQTTCASLSKAWDYEMLKTCWKYMKDSDEYRDGAPGPRQGTPESRCILHKYNPWMFIAAAGPCRVEKFITRIPCIPKHHCWANKNMSRLSAASCRERGSAALPCINFHPCFARSSGAARTRLATTQPNAFMRDQRCQNHPHSNAFAFQSEEGARRTGRGRPLVSSAPSAAAVLALLTEYLK